MTIPVPSASDDIDGAIGLSPLDPGVVVLFRFGEQDTDILPVDDAGALSSLQGSPTLPAVVGAYTGNARRFTGAESIISVDAAGLAILQRTVSVLALVTWDEAATAGPDAIISHGLPDGTVEERRSWYLRIANPSPGVGRLEWVWDDSAGVEQVQAGQEFLAPTSGTMLIAATREWAGDGYRLRYWISGVSLGPELVSTDLDVSGGIPATVVIGGTGDGAGAIVERFVGDIDQVVVLNLALTDVLVRYIWQRISAAQADMESALISLEPPGEARTSDRDSLVGRVRKVRASALGMTSAMIQLQRDAGQPVNAFGAQLDAWAKTVNVERTEDQTVEQTRQQILAILNLNRGLSDDALSSRIALLSDGLIVWLLQDHLLSFAWADVVLPHAFVREPGASSSHGHAAGDPWVTAVPIGPGALWQLRDAPHLRQWVSGDEIVVGAKIDSYTASDESVGGVFVAGTDHVGLAVGLDDAGNLVRAALTPDGGLEAAVIIDAAPPSPLAVRVECLSGVLIIKWGDDLVSPAFAVTVGALGFEPNTCGVLVVSQELTGAATLTLSEHLAYFPESLGVFGATALMDATGSELEATRELVRRVGAAYGVMMAASVPALLCGDPENGVGETLLGDGIRDVVAASLDCPIGIVEGQVINLDASATIGATSWTYTTSPIVVAVPPGEMSSFIAPSPAPDGFVILAVTLRAENELGVFEEINCNVTIVELP